MVNSVRFPVKSILLIGPTGSGKTPLGEHIAKHGINGSRCVHFDFGQELRSIGDSDTSPQGFSKDDHSFIKDVLDKGLLLENEHFHMAGKIMTNFLEQKKFGENDTLLLNGLPRHIGQAEDVARVAHVRKLVVLECSPEDVLERIRMNAGGDREGRTDDSIAMVREKLRIFRERTRPLIDYYSDRQCGIALLEVKASSSADIVYQQLLQSLNAFPDER